MSQTNLKNNPNSALLKETRLAKGLTLEVVHEATKIPMDALRAIEDGYSTRILTPFYYRGFIKIYGEFLGLNVHEVLKEYNVQSTHVITSNVTTPVKKPSSSNTASKSKIKSEPAEPKGPSVLDQLPDIWKRFWTAKTKKNLLRIAAGIFALFIFVKMIGCVANAFKSRPRTAKVAPVSKQQAPKKTAGKKEETKDEPKEKYKKEISNQASEAKEEASKVAAASQIRKVTLAVRATRDTWIQVKADGKTVFEMTMKKGTMENWEADRDIELSGRNIGSLNVEVNGRDVSPLSSFNRRANKVWITKDGLSVKK